MAFAAGQRWHSLTEPELGLGLVKAVEGRQVVIAFPARDVVRRYAAADHPLARARLTAGQEARSEDGRSLTIEEVIDAELMQLVERALHHVEGALAPQLVAARA